MDNDDNISSLNENPGLSLEYNQSFEGYWDNFNLNTSKYLSETNFIRENTGSKSFSIFGLNIQSLPSKFLELRNIFSLFSVNNIFPSIFCIQETWLPTNVFNSYNICGYNIYGKSRTQRVGGGVCIYVKNEFHAELLNDESDFIEGIYESCALKVNISNSKKAIVLCLYRPNNHPFLTRDQQISQFQSIFTQQLTRLMKFKLPIYISMDSNLDLLKCGSDANCDSLFSNCSEQGFIFLNSKATRLSNFSSSLIDQIVTNDSPAKILSTGTIVESPSDHLISYTFLDYHNFRCAHKGYVLKRNISSDGIENFKTILNSLTWENVLELDCPHQAAVAFSNTFLDFFNLSFPLTRKNVNKNKHPHNPWMTKGLLISRLHKLKLDRKAKKYPTQQNLNNFRTYRNIFNSLIKRAKRIYYGHKLNNTNGDSKKLWKVINEINGKANGRVEIDEMTINGQSTSDQIEICNAFNTYFVSIGENIINSVPKTNVNFHSYLPPPIQDSFFISPTTPAEVELVSKQLKGKTSTDVNDISTSMVKSVISSIKEPLAHIFNLSAQLGKFPDCFKVSKTICIFKQGARTDMSNYRGISLVNSFSKLFERLLANRLLNFLNKHNFFHDDQFGFLPKRNTTQAAFQVINFISNAINNGEFCIGIFLDIQKAFDSVNWDILFAKLENAGIRGTALNLFKSYFQNRTQVVKIGNNTSSNTCKISCSVLQGTILGVIFFLIEINDLPRASSFFKTSLFADDGCNLAKDGNFEALMYRANIEIKKIVDWYTANKFAIHPTKSRLMIFRPKHNQPDIEPYVPIFLNLNDPNECNISKIRPIRAVPNHEEDSIKLLGFNLDNKLSMSSHVNFIKGKLNSTNYCLRKAKDYLDEEHLKLMYFSFFFSHLNYSAIFLNMATTSSINQLRVQQNTALRIIFDRPALYNSNSDYVRLNCLPIQLLIKFISIKFMYDYANNHLSPGLKNIWFKNSALRPNLNLRNNNDLFEPPPKYLYLLNHPYLDFPRIWNSVSSDLKEIRPRTLFLQKLKSDLFRQLM